MTIIAYKLCKKVLISTYWNVNASEGALSGVDTSFNLNLLECKLLKTKNQYLLYRF